MSEVVNMAGEKMKAMDAEMSKLFLGNGART